MNIHGSMHTLILELTIDSIGTIRSIKMIFLFFGLHILDYDLNEESIATIPTDWLRYRKYILLILVGFYENTLYVDKGTLICH